VDILVAPTAGTIYRIAEVEADPVRLNSNLGRYTNFMNLLDLSAIAVPAGFQRDGLPSSDRQGIDQGLLTVIPRVIKAEEARQAFPEVNFLLLCSLAVGDLLRQIRAIERRTGWHELTSNSFGDVNAFFQYLQAHRPRVATAVAHYPDGLKEAAFFAANRNFGWFNVVMHHAHENHRDGKVSTPELLRKFADSATKGGQDSVFDTAALGPTRVEPDDDYGEVVRAIYSLLPREIGAVPGIDPVTAKRFLAKVDHGQSGRPLFTEVLEIIPPARHRVNRTLGALLVMLFLGGMLVLLLLILLPLFVKEVVRSLLREHRDAALEICDGLAEPAEREGAALLGGDLTRSPVLSVCVTAVGLAPSAELLVGRSGAEPGDAICATGSFGGAAAGLMLLEHPELAAAVAEPAARAAHERQLSPQPRLAAGRALAAAGATAMKKRAS